jgi:hypothetical protein
MNDIIYKNKVQRAFSVIGIGTILLLFSLYKFYTLTSSTFFNVYLAIAVLFIGIGFFFKGLIGLFNRKPQLIISTNGLYIGLKDKKNIPWSNIEAIIDKLGRTVWVLKIRASKTKTRNKKQNLKVF